MPLLTLTLTAAVPEAAPAPRPVLETAQAVRRLSREEAAALHPVRLEGVVTYANPRRRDFFVQDATAGIYVHPTDLSRGLKAGDRVVVEAHTDPGHFAPCLRAQRITRLGAGELPVPLPFDMTRDESRWLDGQYVQSWGTVRELRTAPDGQVSLHVMTPKGMGFVVIPRESARAARQLLESLIPIRGVAVAGFDREGIVSRSPRVFVSELPKPVALSGEDTPYFAARISDLFQRFVPDPLPAPRWVRVGGVVTASPRDDLLYLQDESDGLEVHLSDRRHYVPGTRVEVTGMLTIRGHRVTLNRATARQLQPPLSGGVIPPRDATHEDLTNGKRIGERVRFWGHLQTTYESNGHSVLVLLVKSVTVTVRVPGTGPAEQLVVGSTIEAIGVPVQETAPEVEAVSAADLRVVRLPPDAPLLRLEQAGTVAAVFIGLAVLVASWVITQRLRITRQRRLMAERQSTRAALEARYRDLFEGAGDAVWVTDRDGAIVALNPAGERLLGLGRFEAMGRRITDFLTPEQADLARASQVARLGAPFELTLASQTGETVQVEVSSQALPDGGVQTIARNVTERKRLLARDMQAQKLEALGQLSGGIAHDFNNLLTVINGSSQILRDRLPDGEPARALAEEVLDAGRRAANLTRQLLAFARQRPTTPTPLDLNQTVAGSVGILGRLVGDDVRIVTELTPDVPWVLAEAALIEQVLMNLAVNARDAMPNGGTLTLRTGRTRGGLVRLSVADSGVGMDEATRARIFEPFFTTKPVGKGTGLGLATVYGAVQTLGGVVRCRSARGQGTVFDVDLPAVSRADRPAAILPRPTVSDPTPLPPGSVKWGKPYTVLLVEDDDAVRSLTCSILQEQGLTVLTAGDGPAALEVCREHADGELHLLITDMMMPNMTGKELVDRARAERPDLRVLFVSGYTADELPETDGASWDFVRKPFTPADLAATVQRVLRRPAERAVAS